MAWGEPDHQHSDYATRSDLDYEADERSRLRAGLDGVDERVTELRDWLAEDIRALWETVQKLQDRVEKLEGDRS